MEIGCDVRTHFTKSAWLVMTTPITDFILDLSTGLLQKLGLSEKINCINSSSVYSLANIIYRSSLELKPSEAGTGSHPQFYNPSIIPGIRYTFIKHIQNSRILFTTTYFWYFTHVHMWVLLQIMTYTTCIKIPTSSKLTYMCKKTNQ